MKKLTVILVSLVLILSISSEFSNYTSAEQQDVVLWNSLKPLDTTVTFLNTGAHPDDERNELLAYLSRGLGVKPLA